MNTYVQKLMANTDELLNLRNAGQAPSEDVSARLGTLDTPNVNIKMRAHLKPRFEGQPTSVSVPPVDQTGEWGKATDTHATATNIKWWSPPKFLVIDRQGDYAIVVGADYNTHEQIRGLRTQWYYNAAGGNDVNRPVQEKIANEQSVVKIHLSYLEGDPPYQIPEVAPPGFLNPTTPPPNR